VLHEPHARDGHREDEHAGYEQQRGHVEWFRRAA
jgi:hypothetical protein